MMVATKPHQQGARRGAVVSD